MFQLGDFKGVLFSSDIGYELQERPWQGFLDCQPRMKQTPNSPHQQFDYLLVIKPGSAKVARNKSLVGKSWINHQRGIVRCHVSGGYE